MGFTGIAVGAALAGLRPICEFMTMNFAMQAIDQIVNSAAKTLYMSGGAFACPVVFRGPNGAAAGVAAQHSQDFATWYGQVPGLQVLIPWSARDCMGMLRAAIRSDTPSVFLENELLYGRTFEVDEGEWNDPDFGIPAGQAEVVRAGSDCTVVTLSLGVDMALEAAESQSKWSLEIINLRSTRPIDFATVFASVRKTGRLVCLEAGWPRFGLGAELAAQVQESLFDHLDAPVLRVAGADSPMPYAATLERSALPALADLLRAVEHVCTGLCK